MNREQLEMRFERDVVLRPAIRRQRRLTRAHWWFERMRLAVDHAWERQASPPANSEREGCRENEDSQPGMANR
jgi:hypothetical protein